MKKIMIYITAFLLFLLTTQTISAQGTYRCGAGPTCINQCEEGYIPNCRITPAGRGGAMNCSPSSDTPCVASPTCGDTGINTAFGCVPIGSQTDLFSFFLKWALGIAGGVALILIIIASITIITSTGDPKRLQAGKELLTAAIAGIMLLIFSVFLLRFIGVTILEIPFLNG